MSDILTTRVSMSVHRKNDNPIFGKTATTVSIADEAAGPYIVITQSPDDKAQQTISLDMDELEAVYRTAKVLIAGYPDEASK